MSQGDTQGRKRALRGGSEPGAQSEPIRQPTVAVQSSIPWACGHRDGRGVESTAWSARPHARSSGRPRMETRTLV